MNGSSDSLADLLQRAQVAQARADWQSSLILWRQTTLIHPEEWTAWLGLALDTASAFPGQMAEAEFERAIERFPENFWIWHHYCTKAGTWLEPGCARSLGERWLQACPGQSGPLVFLAEMSRNLWQVDHAYNYSKAAIGIEPGNSFAQFEFQHASRYLQQYERWTSRNVQCPGRSDYLAAVINLDGSPGRWQRMEAELRHHRLDYRRVPGLRGSYLPALAARKLTGTPDWSAGTIGVFLSHVALYEQVMKHPAENFLVLEDDATFCIQPPLEFDQIGIPEGYDICFVNQRMEVPDVQAGVARTLPYVIHPIDAVRSWLPENNAPGGDGYFISRRGCEKLLARLAQDGFFGDIDWRLLSYSCDTTAIGELPAHSIARTVLSAMQRFHEGGALEAYSLQPSLVRTLSNESLRSQDDMWSRLC